MLTEEDLLWSLLCAHKLWLLRRAEPVGEPLGPCGQCSAELFANTAPAHNELCAYTRSSDPYSLAMLYLMILELTR